VGECKVLEKAGEQSMQEESSMEQGVEFIVLPSTIQPKVTAMGHAPQ
jgi:hypothetical protein